MMTWWWHNDDIFTKGNCQIVTSGVTDFKAVKDNSRSEGSRSGVFDPSLYFLIAGAAFATTLTIAAICVVVTFRRKVGTDYWLLKVRLPDYWLVRVPDMTFPKQAGWETWLATENILIIYFKPYISGAVRRHFVPRHFVPGHILSRDNMSPGQYVALCPHYFAVQRGDILSQETYCPGSVRRHIVPGDVLSQLAPNGNFWQQMVTFGNKC